MRRSLVLLLLVLAGCDRATVDPVGTDLLSAEPDLSAVRLEPDLALRLRPNGLGGALAVTVDGAPAPFDSLEGVYLYRTTLRAGLNALRIAVTDDAGFVRRDTLYAVHFPLRELSLVGSQVGTPRAGGAAAPLLDGRILITGGVGINGRALGTATVLQPGGAQIEARDTEMGTPRAGHTASVLPDGRVLLVGGALTDRPTSSGEFVQAVEVVDPGATSALPVAVDAPPRRAGHTAQVLTANGETYVYLYGGLVPAGSGTTVSGSVDIYRLDVIHRLGGDRETRLTRLTPEGGAGRGARVAQHVQVPLGPRQALVLGRAADDEAVALTFSWLAPTTATFPFDLSATPVPEAGGREGAAAVDVGAVVGDPGLVLVLGGETNIGRTGSMEVVAPDIGRTFRVPDALRLRTPRSGHTATILSNGRILVFGGRSESGAALSTLEAFEL